MLAHQRLRGIAIYRTFFSSTIATSVAVAAVVFGTLLNPRVGVVGAVGAAIRAIRTFLRNSVTCRDA